VVVEVLDLQLVNQQEVASVATDEAKLHPELAGVDFAGIVVGVALVLRFRTWI
jgi:hypothetical protein